MKFNAITRSVGIGPIAYAILLMCSQIGIMACAEEPVPEFDIRVGMTMAEFSAQKGAQALFSDIVERGKKQSWAATEDTLKANVVLPKGRYAINHSKTDGFFSFMWSPYPQLDGNFYITHIRTPISALKLDFDQAKAIAKNACNEMQSKINLRGEVTMLNPSIHDVDRRREINVTSICSMTDESGLELSSFLEHRRGYPSIFIPNVWIKRPLSDLD